MRAKSTLRVDTKTVKLRCEVVGNVEVNNGDGGDYRTTDDDKDDDLGSNREGEGFEVVRKLTTVTMVATARLGEARR